MSRIPQVKPKKLVSILIRLGFYARKGRGSHVVFVHPDGRRTVIPMHNRPVRIGNLRAILRQIDIPVNEFLILLRKKK